ncbi:MAG: BTAD domain-containing putative transcriptional regulator [Umezawaea sp.]
MEIELLGGVVVRDGGRPVDVGHARQRCVLAALLVEANEVVPAARLIDQVWGDEPPDTSRATLTTYVARLRRALAPFGLSIRGRSGGYVLAVDPDAVDLHRFRALVARARAESDDGRAAELFARALGLRRGTPLADIDGGWAATVRSGLERERHEAELDHVDVLLGLGEHATVLEALAGREAAHPLDERVAGQAVLALHRAGRRADAVEHYRRFAERMAEELGADPSPALRELHRHVAAGGVGTPRQLPAPPGLFTGREAELKSLTLRLDRRDRGFGTAVISAIGGGGGIGKTWLALRWAHEHAARFPDGQVYVDLRGFDPTAAPVTPTAALRGFLRALGVTPASVPPGTDGQSALYRDLVAGKRLLVLLDNAAHAAQVMPLLPLSDTCTTVVTSRLPLSELVHAYGALPVPLDVLSDDEARDLLAGHLGRQRVEADPAVVAELLEHCAGLPLALGIVAARAAVRPDLPLAALAEELRDHEARLDGLDAGESDLSLRAVLSWSYRPLSPEAVRLVGLLALAPGAEISADAVASLSPAPPAGPLRELEAAHLITHDDDRYRMHDLVQLYAAERAARDLPDDVRSAALRRVVDHHLHTAHAADRLLDPHRPPIEIDTPVAGVVITPLADDAAATAWLTTEHTVVAASQRLAASHGWHRLAWRTGAALDTFYFRQGHVAEHLAVLHVNLVSARATGDRATEVRMHLNLGHIYAQHGSDDESVDQLERGIALAELIGDPVYQAHGAMTLAQTKGQQGDVEGARSLATDALRLYRSSGNRSGEANALNQIGWTDALLGDHGAARTHCRAALDLHRELGLRAGEADALDSLGYVHERAGDPAEAVRHYLLAIDLFEELGHARNAATTLEQLGRARIALGQHDQARAAWQETLRLYRMQDRTAEGDALERRLADMEAEGSGGAG